MAEWKPRPPKIWRKCLLIVEALANSLSSELTSSCPEESWSGLLGKKTEYRVLRVTYDAGDLVLDVQSDSREYRLKLGLREIEGPTS